MNDNSLYAFIALIIPVAIGRFLLHQSLEKLAPEKKEALLNSVSGMQKVRFLAIFSLVGIIYFLPETTIFILPIYIIGLTWIYWKKVSKENPPKHYTQAFFTSMVLGIIGIGAFLYLQQGSLFNGL